MWSTALSVLLVAYVPGAVIFRLPIAKREQRAGLPPEERMFWSIILSLVLSSVVVLALAAAGAYRFDRLIVINGVVCLALMVGSRGRLRLSTAPRPGLWALAPALLAAFAFAVFFAVPPAEYVVGGRDPGVYINEGIQIAQRGSLVVHDPLIETLPPEFRRLFILERADTSHYGTRFMSFFVTDPDAARVVGQFPHLFPAWVAVGYGVNGLSGARQVIGVLAILGVVAVYFCGAWLLGRPAAVLGALLLTLNVAEVWYSRYPNAEILTQLLVFAAILAFSRATIDEDRFFAPVAASLLALSMLAHFSAVLIVGAVGLTVLLGIVDNRRPQAAFLIPLALGSALVAWYYGTILSEYLVRPAGILGTAGPVHLTLISIGSATLLALVWFAWRGQHRMTIRTWVPWCIGAALTTLATYAYFFRVPVGSLAPHDAEALREFARVYLSPLGLLMTLLGLWVLIRRAFWPGLAFLIPTIVFSCFIFYKIRIIPEHFWLARRFLPIVLPSACLLIGNAVWLPTSIRLPSALDRRDIRAGLQAFGFVLLLLLAGRAVSATQPIVDYVEYAGVIPRLEALAGRFDDTDLVIVESRQVSDLHVLAAPLAYIYARQVLLLTTEEPDPSTFRDFLVWAGGRYRRVLFVGGSGSRMLSRSTAAVPLTLERFQVPEYERSYPTTPRIVRQKDFSFGIYELSPRLTTSTSFELDIGSNDDLYVERFYDKETMSGRDTTFRWSQAGSFILVPALSAEARVLTLWLNAGDRPEHVATADVEVRLNEVFLGAATPTDLFQPFRFEIPPSLASEIGANEAAAVLRLDGMTWSPRVALGEDDSRDLGVMVDRIMIE